MTPAVKVSSLILLCGAFACGLASLWLEGLPPGGRSALVLGLFLLAAGMPAGRGGPSPIHRAAFLLALAAAPLALAVAMDRAQGARTEVLVGLLPGLVALVCLGAAAARPSIAYLVGWLLLGLGLPLGRSVLGFGGPAAELAASTPLGFVFARAAAPAPGTMGDGLVVVLALLLAAASRVGREEA